MMTQDNRSLRGTAFTVSIDARHGITTGISARERAHTILTAVAAQRRRRRPGHARAHLPAARAGAAACWSAPATPRRPSIWPAWPGASRPGSSARSCARTARWRACPTWRRSPRAHGLGIVRIADLIQYRLSREMLVRRLRRDHGAAARRRAERRVPGLRLRHRRRGDPVPGAGAGRRPRPTSPVLVRVQSAELRRDVFGIGRRRPEAGHPAAWLRMIEEEGRGVFLYVCPAPAGPDRRPGGAAAAARDARARPPPPASGHAAARLRPGRPGAGAPGRAQRPAADQQAPAHRRPGGLRHPRRRVRSQPAAGRGSPICAEEND